MAADGPTGVVMDVDVDIRFTSCGHVHNICSGDRHTPGGWPAGVSYIFPQRSCAERFVDCFGPHPGNAGLSGQGGTAGRIAGVRLAE